MKETSLNLYTLKTLCKNCFNHDLSDRQIDKILLDYNGACTCHGGVYYNDLLEIIQATIY